MHMANPTDRVYCFIAAFVNVCGYPPTIREICDGLAIKSTATVHRYLKKLVEDGRIEMQKNQNRTIHLLASC